MALRVVNTNTVLQELKDPGQKNKTTYGMNHHRKFTFKNVKNNIIRATFFAQQVSFQQFVSNVQALNTFLSQSTTVSLEQNDSTTYLMKVKKRPDRGDVLVYFNYVAGSLSDTINEGQLYERQIITKLNRAGYTQQTEPDTGLGDPDVIINAKGVTVGVELKEKIGASFGSATLHFTGGHWKLKSTPRQNPAIPSIVETTQILNEVNKKWDIASKGLVSANVTRATKELQGILGEISKFPINSSHIRKYYEKCDYIHIKGKGFYKLKSADPLNCGATFFDPTDSYIRVRVQYKSGSYRFALELYIGNVIVSSVRLGLDDDNFNFLK